MTAGHDTLFGNGGEQPDDGKAIGQIFYAQDTVITKITLWRPAYNLSATGAHLFVTGIDTSRAYVRPQTSQVYLDGPTVTVFSSTPPGSLIEMPFVIDPPLHLPRTGRYAFFVQAENCFPAAVWVILADWNNRYPEGSYWLTNRALTSCYLPFANWNKPDVDLIFEIEYCHDTTTPVHRASWGQLRILYR